MSNRKFEIRPETLALAVNALTRCEFRYGKFVFLTGLDEVAVLCGETARSCGAAAVVFRVTNEDEKKQVEEMGFLAFQPDVDNVKELLADVTQNRKFDIVIETTGSLSQYDLLIQLVKRGACVAAMKAPAEPYYFHVCDVIRDQIHFMGITSYDEHSLQTAQRMIASKTLA